MKYREQQFMNLDPNSETFRIKVTSDAGETKWLSISPAEKELIRLILTLKEG